MPKKTKKPNKKIIAAGGIIVFAAIAVFGLSPLSNNFKPNVKNSKASAQEPADLNSDNKVDVSDLSILLDNWNKTGTNSSDLNNDSTVNIYDLSKLLSKWGAVVVAVASPKTINPGAKLPIQFDVATLNGTVRYVATTGNDTTGTGTIGSPYATLKKAESVSANGDSIVVRGGTYPITANATVIDRSNLTITAYPNEIPIFDGSILAANDKITDGAQVSVSYQPMPAGLGEGLSLANLPTATFSGTTPTGLAAERGWRCVTVSATYTVPDAATSANPSGCPTGSTPNIITGYYPDQVWVNGTALKQVLDKSKVVSGTFWVDRSSATDAAPTTSRLYMSASDAVDMSKVRFSASHGTFLQVSAGNTTIRGLKIMNHSPTWSQYALLVANHNTTIENVSIESSASTAIKVAYGSSLSTLATGTSFRGVTVTRSGWVGAVLYYNNDTTLDSVLFSYTEQHKEFNTSPQRGAIKSTKSDRTKILNSAFENNGLGVWFDQSNYITDIAGNRFVGNTDSSVFYEISHGLTLVNNYINGNNATAASVRLAGSSDMKIINNTIIGGYDLFWVGVDARSKQFTAPDGQIRDCSEHMVRYKQAGDALTDCWVGYTSDFDMARPGAYSPTGAQNLTPGMSWGNSFTVFANNVLANPNNKQHCSTFTVMCAKGFIDWNSSKGRVHFQVPLNKLYPPNVIHDGNIYQVSSGKIYIVDAETAVSQQGGISASNLTDLKGALGFGSAYYGLSVEQHGLSAASGLVDTNGILSSSVNHANAASVPTDATINHYIPAGTKHYGAFGY